MYIELIKYISFASIKCFNSNERKTAWNHFIYIGKEIYICHICIYFIHILYIALLVVENNYLQLCPPIREDSQVIFPVGDSMVKRQPLNIVTFFVI